MMSAVTGPVDLFYAANAIAKARSHPIRFRWRLATPAGGQVESSTELSVATTQLRAAPHPHVVLVAGPGVTTVAELDHRLSELGSAPALSRWLRRYHDAGATVGASCAGVFVLAQLGLLDRRTVTTTWWLADEFRRRYPEVHLHPSAMVVPDDSFVTAGAAMAHLDLALHLIRRFCGAELAQLVARYMVTDLGRGSQALYAIADELRSADPLVKRAMAVLAVRGGLALSVAQVAQKLGVTSRTLHRRFRGSVGLTPQSFIARERVRHAKGLLEATTLSVDDIAARVGFVDLSAFARAFKREARVTPGAYRRTFGAVG